MKKPSNMTDAEWKAYRARVARRQADPGYADRVAKRKATPEEPLITVQVGAMTAEVEPGPDKKFGTPDDAVDITPLASLSKNKLLKLAKNKGIEVPKNASKEEILDLLN